MTAFEDAKLKMVPPVVSTGNVSAAMRQVVVGEETGDHVDTSLVEGWR